MAHCLLALTGLLHDEVLLLDVLELLALGLLLERGQLPATLVDLSALRLHHLDLVQRHLELLVKRVHVQEVLV